MNESTTLQAFLVGALTKMSEDDSNSVVFSVTNDDGSVVSFRLTALGMKDAAVTAH